MGKGYKMKKVMAIISTILAITLLFSCGKAKQKLQDKMLETVESKAEEMGVTVDLDDVSLDNGFIEGLAEGAIVPGAESLQKQLEAAFSDEALQEMAESMGALDAAFERDAEGNIINMKIEDEGTVINMDGSTPWPEEMPAKIPEYTDGMIFTYQIEEEDNITVVIGDTTAEEVASYVAQIKPLFDTLFEITDEDWVYSGASESDGMVVAYDEGSLYLQYYFHADFADDWQMSEGE